jgi:CDGSH-type Zn-finger protein
MYRCSEASNQAFCDGTQASVDFDGTPARPPC